jgi:hypothetical protein
MPEILSGHLFMWIFPPWFSPARFLLAAFLSVCCKWLLPFFFLLSDYLRTGLAAVTEFYGRKYFRDPLFAMARPSVCSHCANDDIKPAKLISLLSDLPIIL